MLHTLPKPAFARAREVERTGLQCTFVERPFRSVEEECIMEGGKNTNVEFFSSVDILALFCRLFCPDLMLYCPDSKHGSI